MDRVLVCGIGFSIGVEVTWDPDTRKLCFVAKCNKEEAAAWRSWDFEILCQELGMTWHDLDAAAKGLKAQVESLERLEKKVSDTERMAERVQSAVDALPPESRG